MYFANRVMSVIFALLVIVGCNESSSSEPLQQNIPDGLDAEVSSDAPIPSADADQKDAGHEPDSEPDSEAGASADPCEPNPCLMGYTCEAHGNTAVCTQDQQDAGLDAVDPADSEPDSEAPVDPCESLSCETARHCELQGSEAVCVADDEPVASDCPLPPEDVDAQTAELITQQRFLLPEDAIPNNNGWIGPFCCTGYTVRAVGTDANSMAFAYFFSWETQAYNIGQTSFVRDVTIFVAGRVDPKNNPQSYIAQNAIHFTAEELASCASKTVWAGAFRVTATPRHADLWRPSCLSGELGYDMSTLTFVIDLKYGYGS